MNANICHIVCWNYLQLGTLNEDEKSASKSKDEIASLEKRVNDLDVKEKIVNQEVGVEA